MNLTDLTEDAKEIKVNEPKLIGSYAALSRISKNITILDLEETTIPGLLSLFVEMAARDVFKAKEDGTYNLQYTLMIHAQEREETK
jgi:hypothetical protein